MAAINAHNVIRAELTVSAVTFDDLRTQLHGVTNELEASEGARESLCAENKSLAHHLVEIQQPPRTRVRVSLGALPPIANEEVIVKQE
jgi:hypothetical protein